MKELERFIENKVTQNQGIQTKNSYIDVIGDNYFQNLDEWQEILAYYAILYYKKCSPVFTAINLLAEEFSSLKPVIFDTKNEKFIKDHPVLDLLGHPFGDLTWREFAKELCSNFLITGNNYTMATGLLNKPPVEIINMYPAGINILPSTRDGFAGKFIVTTPFFAETFTRDEKTGYWRFINGMGTRELWQIKDFNPRNRAGLGNYGMSKLTPIYFEITQNIFASLHNIGLLKNGAKLSTAFIAERPLQPDQYKMLMDDINSKYVGPVNTGKPILLQNGLKIEQYGLNNQEMDFFNLSKSSVEKIYNLFKIPLALINIEKATLNNMDKSILGLYDFAVIPLADRLFEELTIFLLSRYKNSENLQITFRKDLIPALQERELEIVTKKQKLGIYTINELRAMLGETPTDGGEDIYIPATNAPISVLQDVELEQGEADTVATDPSTEADPDDEENDTNQDVGKLYAELHHLNFKDGSKIHLGH